MKPLYDKTLRIKKLSTINTQIESEVRKYFYIRGNLLYGGII